MVYRKSKPILSICIPTYNRSKLLVNALNSIEKSLLHSRDYDVQVCISDNASTDETSSIIDSFKRKFSLKINRNQSNEGLANNFLRVVDLADGEFCWILGDDDLLLTQSIRNVCKLIQEYPNIDYFYINSFHLSTEYVFQFQQPFNTDFLPSNMERFSKFKVSRELPFLKLVSPKVSFDFLGGVFLSLFRTDLWKQNKNCVNLEALRDSRTYSHFDNTFVHVKIFANSFKFSRAYFLEEPQSVCLSGAREWAPMYPLIRSIRLVEALEEYRKNSLPMFDYLKCRNFALQDFIPDFIRMYFNKDKSGWQYVKVNPSLLFNLCFPNLYLSFVYFLVRKVYGKFSKFLKKT